MGILLCMEQQTASNDAPKLTNNGIDVGDDYELVSDLLRDAHGEPLVETDRFILFRDLTGHELNEFVDDMAVDRRELSIKMHELARKVYDDGKAGDEWSTTDPVVLAK